MKKIDLFICLIIMLLSSCGANSTQPSQGVNVKFNPEYSLLDDKISLESTIYIKDKYYETQCDSYFVWKYSFVNIDEETNEVLLFALEETEEIINAAKTKKGYSVNLSIETNCFIEYGKSNGKIKIHFSPNSIYASDSATYTSSIGFEITKEFEIMNNNIIKFK